MTISQTEYEMWPYAQATYKVISLWKLTCLLYVSYEFLRSMVQAVKKNYMYCPFRYSQFAGCPSNWFPCTTQICITYILKLCLEMPSGVSNLKKFCNQFPYISFERGYLMLQALRTPLDYCEKFWLLKLDDILYSPVIGWHYSCMHGNPVMLIMLTVPINQNFLQTWKSPISTYKTYVLYKER